MVDVIIIITCVYAFIENCFHLADKNTIVMLDDTIFIDGWEKEWTIGPRTEKTLNNKISELARRKRDVVGKIYNVIP